MSVNNSSCMSAALYMSELGLTDSLSLPVVQLLIAAVYLTLLAAGVALNGRTLLLLYVNGDLLKPHNILLANLLLADLTICLIVLPITPATIVQKTWLFGRVLCRLLSCLQSAAVITVSWSLTAIAIIRFVHIRDRTRAPLRRAWALLLCAAIWSMGFALNTPVMLATHLADGKLMGDKRPLCGWFCVETWSGTLGKKAFGICATAMQFVLPGAIITYCYWRVAQTIASDGGHNNRMFHSSVRSHNLMVGGNSKSLRKQKIGLQMKRRAHFRMMLLMGTFVVCWMPIVLTNLLRDFDVDPLPKWEPYLFYLALHAVAMSSVLWNPLFMYTHKRTPVKRSTITNTADRSGSVSQLHSISQRRSTFRSNEAEVNV